MTISEQIQSTIEELISQYGIGYRISAQELKALIKARYSTNYSSIIPPDYCYNRVNKGIDFIEKPRLLARVERGIYECLGKNYLYDGLVYAQPKGSKNDIVVGVWKNGIFAKNENWEHHCMK